ncbi:MAG: group II truncated hemoglobin [Myxococcales bacterium]|nr:group II truncated hemoglobin [Myxococcales bacterium]
MTYGTGDASFHAAGGREGLRQLVDAFYRHMDTLPEARVIRAMHDEDLTLAREKLLVFLCGWLGGPKEYAARFGPIRIPAVHAHLTIDEPERDAWLQCMAAAVAEQSSWSPDFAEYFLGAIAVPAERVRRASAAARED